LGAEDALLTSLQAWGDFRNGKEEGEEKKKRLASPGCREEFLLFAGSSNGESEGQAQSGTNGRIKELNVKERKREKQAKGGWNSKNKPAAVETRKNPQQEFSKECSDVRRTSEKGLLRNVNFCDRGDEALEAIRAGELAVDRRNSSKEKFEGVRNSETADIMARKEAIRENPKWAKTPLFGVGTNQEITGLRGVRETTGEGVRNKGFQEKETWVSSRRHRETKKTHVA